jgi:hypothetical protein
MICLMKNNILFILSLIFLLSSCAGTLDQYSHTAIPPDAVVEGDLPAVRTGMYNRVQEAPGTLTYVIFDFVGGDINQKEYTPIQLIDAQLKSGSTMSGEWNGFYSALYQVNNTMYVASRLPGSPIQKTVLGEAHYFRAFIYMSLVTRFGGVPLLRENTQDIVARSSAEECWELIYEDITKAVELLGTTNTYYYVSKDAAKALKARICLYMGKKDEAKNLAEELITSGKYKLDTFENIFNTYPTRKNNSETIFAFLCQDQAQSGIQIGNEFYSYDYVYKGKGTYTVPQSFYDSWESNDNRKARSVISEGGYYRLNKYPAGQGGTDPVNISRISEMYLISAEAQGYPMGVARLNELRAARGLGGASVTNDASFLNAILKERRFELFGENHRWYDLVRTGKAIEELGIKEFQLLFPIPDTEITKSKKVLVQNPGY